MVIEGGAEVLPLVLLVFVYLVPYRFLEFVDAALELRFMCF